SGFFFQAEDGIRYWSVTGVQTCALPISSTRQLASSGIRPAGTCPGLLPTSHAWPVLANTTRSRPSSQKEGGFSSLDGSSRSRPRSEERRVGEEGRAGWGAVGEKRKTKEC